MPGERRLRTVPGHTGSFGRRDEGGGERLGGGIGERRGSCPGSGLGVEHAASWALGREDSGLSAARTGGAGRALHSRPLYRLGRRTASRLPPGALSAASS
ncbi:hypothetical protein D187_002947 [Cystobacter fuscus DSM 2262]|uniref:Uncharacterized protein n=1 Tax=Cystobacter fuscus (strain ATCC 25194 / DSM 2262 / NBRC 100088 / M29) TaxID=1242864 RepID=S9PB08_CYSF2|nr:hypothetical protein D187_002947 [Cystobacter fuscus DSM 2262]